VQDTLDALILPHQRHAATVGECIEALVLTMLTGERALARVAEALAGYDVEVIFQRPANALHFHDNRLGRALGALWEAGLDRSSGAVTSRATQRYALDRARPPTDATSLKLSGVSERDAETEGPLITYGYSRDHRPDLKRLLCGRTVTAEGIPGWGHVTDGHPSDSAEPRVHITPLRQHLPDLGEPLVVAGGKFFAGETITLAAAHRFRFVTLVPQAVCLRHQVVAAPELASLPLLWEQPGRRKGEREAYHGASVVRLYHGQTAAGEVPEWLLRFLVVESTPLAKAKAPRLAAAHQAATLCLRERCWHYHHLSDTVSPAWVLAKRATRGRPPKDAPRPQRRVWHVIWQVHEAAEAITTQAQREGRFVLATHVLDAQELTDAELLRAYNGRPAAELSFKWAKNPAALAPIFLETPTRIAALGCVYLIALLVYTPVERHVRKALAECGGPLPNRPAPSQRPTARTVFSLMRNLAVVTLAWAGQLRRHVTTLNARQLLVRRLLGSEPSTYASPQQNSG